MGERVGERAGEWAREWAREWAPEWVGVRERSRRLNAYYCDGSVALVGAQVGQCRGTEHSEVIALML
jgi:prepilin-type processing-associated H-X9-DG protein